MRPAPPACRQMNDSPDCFLTPPEVAKRLRVSPTKILAWIRRGELKAVNVSDGSRPRFRISPTDLLAFLTAREVQPAAKHYLRRREPPKGGPIEPSLVKH
jgi:excisionase family DNA binding protein